MIRLQHILNEISVEQSERLLSKIKNKQYQFLDSGDNGKVLNLMHLFQYIIVMTQITCIF